MHNSTPKEKLINKLIRTTKLLKGSETEIYLISSSHPCKADSYLRQRQLSQIQTATAQSNS